MSDISGIYKITNPVGKIYIGQSRYLYKRKKNYSNANCFAQPKIYESIKKYGFDKHKFEIIKKCSWEKLNRYEFHYQKKYKSVENGLNCVYTKTQPNLNLIKLQDFFKRLKNESRETLACYSIIIMFSIFVIFMIAILFSKFKEKSELHNKLILNRKEYNSEIIELQNQIEKNRQEIFKKDLIIVKLKVYEEL